MDKILYTYTIYKPTGFKGVIAQRFKIEAGEVIRDKDNYIIGNLDMIRDYLAKQGFTKFDRHLNDASDIIETWI